MTDKNNNETPTTSGVDSSDLLYGLARLFLRITPAYSNHDHNPNLIAWGWTDAKNAEKVHEMRKRVQHLVR